MLKIDNNKLAVNAPETYEYVASVLKNAGNCLITWTDGRSVQFDILFVLRPKMAPDQLNTLQGGITSAYLFVSIMRLGAFAFRTGGGSGQNYYAEKLGVPFDVGHELAALINGIRALV